MEKKTKEKIKVINTDNRNFEVEFPLYFDCYLQALGIVFDKILDEAERKKNGIGTSDISQECNNIIAFVGKRGTGKTTALKEFCKILGSATTQQKDKWIEEMQLSEQERYILKSRVNFCMLPLIDVSLLDEKEDVFELILAAMFEKYDKEYNGTHTYDHCLNPVMRRRRVAESFGNVYRNYHNVRQRRDNEDIDESVISKLRAFSSSMKTQEAFDCLLKHYFEDFDSTADFLVIVIDDLDLNLKHGFEMLDQLHKYFSHPQVIILTTFSYEQLLLVTENHFRRNTNQMCDDMEKGYSISPCHQLAIDYLDKIIPVGNRVYMPRLTRIPTKYQISEETVEGYVKTTPIKIYLLRKIAERIGVFYDGAGIKTHFIEKSTIRALATYNAFLEAKKPVDFSQCKIVKGEYENLSDNDKRLQNSVMRQYEQNCEWFIRDIHDRMIYEKLSTEQREFFHKLLSVDLRRRAGYTVLFKQNWVLGKPLDADIEKKEYRYGDFLECIYSWGREHYDDRNLIQCILASFTSEMTREYFNYLYNCKESGIAEEAKGKLYNFIGKSFGSEWTKGILPIKWLLSSPLGEVRADIWADNIGYLKDIELKFSPIEFYIDIQELSGECIVNGIESSYIIPIMECFNMLITNCKMNGKSYPRLSCKIETKMDSKIVIEVSFNTDKGDFDIFGFVGKSLGILQEQKEFTEQFIDMLAKKLSNIISPEDSNVLQQVLQERLFELSIFKGKEKACEEVAFPFYDLDVSYNVIKRVRRRAKEDLVQPIAYNEIAKQISQIYDFISEELGKQKDVYDSEEYSVYRYQEIFDKNPFICAMRNGKYQGKFSEILGNMLKAGTITHSDIAKEDVND